jgi:NTE family protein
MSIPFACVATDLVPGKKYIFRTGSFATAIRSTMSLPGYFSPVHIDGHIFADCGLLDNLPVDFAKQVPVNAFPLADRRHSRAVKSGRLQMAI